MGPGTCVGPLGSSSQVWGTIMCEDTRRDHADMGAASIEYAMLASMIAAVIAAVVFSVGQQTFQHFYRFWLVFGSM